MRLFEERLRRLSGLREDDLFRRGRKGIEKETLRVDSAGTIASTPHPRALGAALTHPWITTDYSEALLELISPPFVEAADALTHLCRLHQFVYGRLDQELLWATSMPCIVGGDESIPIARYGTSNRGMMKHIYRRGLAYRYGRQMQVISGVHFNYSLPDDFWPLYQDLEQSRLEPRSFIDDAYFGLIRNVQRFGWLIMYLFGASPAVCKSFLAGRATTFQEFDADTWYEPFATSLRMSDIGYRNKSPSELIIRYDSLDSYVESLTRAIETPYPAYREIGVVVDGEYRQLNANYLQIENEYYSSVRPKRVPNVLEKPTLALERRGVQYVELRSVDVNPFEPCGVNEDQLRFLEAFMLLCLLSESPRISDAERPIIDHNQGTTTRRGRDPEVRLLREGREVPLSVWAEELLDALEGICTLLDASDPERAYGRALAVQRASLRDPDRTPSARVLAEMRGRGESFFRFARRISEQHRDHFERQSLDEAFTAELERMARDSIREQAAIEASDDLPFDEFLRRYFAQG